MRGFPQPLPLPWASGTAHLPHPPCQGTCSGRESQRWSTMTVTVERDTWDACALPGPSQAGVCAEAPTVPTVLPPQDLGTQGRRFARPPRVTLPIPPTHRRVHSRASQVRPPPPATCRPCLVVPARLRALTPSPASAAGPLLPELRPGPQSGPAAAVGAAPLGEACGPGPTILPAAQGERPRQVDAAAQGQNCRDSRVQTRL